MVLLNFMPAVDYDMINIIHDCITIGNHVPSRRCVLSALLRSTGSFLIREWLTLGATGVP